MKRMRRIAKWLFSAPRQPSTLLGVIAWWEIRRIPFSLIVGGYAIVCLLIFLWAIASSGHLQLGEDALEPMALVVAPLAVNALYTLGWLIEIPTRFVKPTLSSQFGPVLLKVGFGLSVFLITIPTFFWSGYRVLQFIGIAK